MGYIGALALSVVISFLLGSIPFGYIVGRMHGTDIREHGSGNTGATNVARTFGAKWGGLVLLLDALKGYLGVMVASALVGAVGGQVTLPALHAAQVASGVAAVLGHVFTPFLGFHGGKGVATGLGVGLALVPIAALVGLAVFLIVVAITRYMSLGSLAGIASAPFSVMFFYDGSVPYLIYSLLLLAVVVVAHRGNIKRLINREEKKFSFGSDK